MRHADVLPAHLFRQYLRDVSRALTVVHIMTPQQGLFTCSPTDDAISVLREMADKNYDIAPVETDGRIHAFVRRQKLESAHSIEEVLCPIDINQLATHTMSLEHLIKLLAAEPGRFYFVMEGNRIIGLVTPADLNKGPVRTFLYTLLAQLESVWTELVRRTFPAEDWIQLLSKDRQKEMRETLEKAKVGNVEVGLIEHLYLSDLLTIVEKTDSLRKQFGFSSRNRVKSALGPLNEWRNRVMHPVRSLIGDQQDVQELSKVCDLVSTLIARAQGGANERCQ